MAQLTSFTALELFRTCARRFLFERIQGKKPGETPEMVVGQVYHAALEQFLRRRVVNPDYDQYAATIDEVVRSEKIAPGLARVGLTPEPIVEEILWNTKDIAMEWMTPTRLWPISIRAGQNQEVPAVEIFFRSEKMGYLGVIDIISQNRPVLDRKGVPITWTPDQPTVLDFKIKTGTRRKSQRDADLSDQLALYSLVSDTTAAGFIEIPRDQRPVVVRVTEYDPFELQSWRASLIDGAGCLEMLTSAAKESQTPERFFPKTPRTNPLCSPLYCPHYPMCYPIDPLTLNAHQGEIRAEKA